jgi:hypothetical protein
MNQDLNFYSRKEHNKLLQSFNHEEFSHGLATFITGKAYSKLEVKPRPHCIEISNAEICIALIIFAGFETHDYNELKYHSNLQLVSLYNIIPEMLEFKNMKIKYINPQDLINDILNNATDYYGQLANNILTIET